MRIGYDAKRLFVNYTGLGNYSRTLVSNYKAAYPENDIYLYSPKAPHNDRTQAFFNDVFHIRTPQGFQKFGWRSKGVVSYLKKDDLDLFHGLSHELPIGIQYSGIKTVVTIHDLIYNFYKSDFPAIDRWIYDKKVRFACDKADRIIAISEATKRDLLEVLKVDAAKIDVLYQGIAPIFYLHPTAVQLQSVREKYRLPQDFILSVGSIIERKNLAVLIKALGRMQPSERPFLVIAGKGKNYERTVDDLIHRFQLSDHVLKIASPGLEDLNCLYHAALFSVYPSMMEGFGLPVLESIASGTPVITTCRSSLTEAGGQAALYFDGKDVDALIDLMRTELSVPTKKDDSFLYRRELHIQQFDTRRLTDQLHSIYLKAMHA